MGRTIGALLPLGAVLAVSAVPLVAFVLVLMTRQRIAKGGGYLLGTAVAVATAAAITAGISVLAPGEVLQTSGAATGVFRVLCGAALLVVGVFIWAKRPRPGERRPMPHWFARIDEIGFRGSFILGGALAVVNFKNLPVLVIAGTYLANAGSTAAALIAGSAFVGVACGLMGLLLAFTALLPRATEKLLSRLRELLFAHHSGALASAFALAGALLVGYGLVAF